MEQVATTREQQPAKPHTAPNTHQPHLPELPDSMHVDQRQLLDDLLIEFQDIFAQHEEDYGHTHSTDHETHMTTPPVGLHYWQ